MRLSIRTFLISIAIVALSLAIAIGRAESQRKAVQNIQDHGGYVKFNDGQFFIGLKAKEEFLPSRSLIRNLRHSVTSAMINKSDYEELREELMRLTNLDEIVVYGDDSDFDLEDIHIDFPKLEVVDLNSVLAKSMRY